MRDKEEVYRKRSEIDSPLCVWRGKRTENRRQLMRDNGTAAVREQGQRTYAADRLGEDGADVHDLELSVGLLEVLGLRDRVGDLQ